MVMCDLGPDGGESGERRAGGECDEEQGERLGLDEGCQEQLYWLEYAHFDRGRSRGGRRTSTTEWQNEIRSESLNLHDEELFLVITTRIDSAKGKGRLRAYISINDYVWVNRTYRKLLIWILPTQQMSERLKARVIRGMCLPSLSLWNPCKNTRSFCLFLRRMLSIAGGFLGLATNTCKIGARRRERIESVYRASGINGTNKRYGKKEEAHLEDMESLKLDILTLIPQQVHHHLEVGLVRDVAGHDRKVCSIQQYLSEKLERLSFGDVVCRHD